MEPHTPLGVPIWNRWPQETGLGLVLAVALGLALLGAFHSVQPGPGLATKPGCLSSNIHGFKELPRSRLGSFPRELTELRACWSLAQGTTGNHNWQVQIPELSPEGRRGTEPKELL